jgi:hypothetical protein
VLLPVIGVRLAWSWLTGCQSFFYNRSFANRGVRVVALIGSIGETSAMALNPIPMMVEMATAGLLYS